MRFGVFFKRGRDRERLIDKFKTEEEAITFAGIEGTQMETIGGIFIIRDLRTRKEIARIKRA